MNVKTKALPSYKQVFKHKIIFCVKDRGVNRVQNFKVYLKKIPTKSTKLRILLFTQMVSLILK